MQSAFRNLIFFIILGCSSAFAQSQQYYVVVGAFAKETNAQKFSGFVRSRFFQATYALNTDRKLFYVYVIKVPEKKEAVDQVLILQKEESFKDSWVFSGNLGIPMKSISDPIQKPKPESSVKPAGITPTSEPTDTTQIRSVQKETESDSAFAPVAIIAEPEVKPVGETVPRKAKGKFFKFAIVSPSGEPFSGRVHHVDLKQGRDIAAYSSNVYSDVLRPANREEPMTIICGIFGYKEVTQLVEYTNPSRTPGSSPDENGVWIIPFKLERLKKGDVSVMYDVSFYKDAVVMLPRSQEELDELVNMMTSNPAYKIKVHGHANGNSKRKIIALGKVKNYFDIKGSKQKNGSSKELSKQRAEAIRDYLKEHGIAANRISIFAWGGTNMLVSETSSSAKLNDRIEIEILED